MKTKGLKDRKGKEIMEGNTWKEKVYRREEITEGEKFTRKTLYSDRET